MKKIFRSAIVIFMSVAVACTAIPVALGELTASAAAPKKPAKVASLKANATSQTTITLKWGKVKTKGTKGYMVYRYNLSTGKWVAVKNIKKATTLTFKDQKLKAGTSYKYKVRAYTTYKQYYNTKTKKWVNKKPAKNNWKTKKSRTKYIYGAYSTVKSFKTKATSGSSVASTDKDTVFTKSSITGTTSLTLNSNGYDYTVHANGSITWSVSDKNIADIGSTFASSKNTTRSCTLYFKKAGTVTLYAKNSLNGKTKSLTITAKSNSSGGNNGSGPDDGISITDYKGTTIKVSKDSPYINNPRYNKNVDGTWADGSITYVQKSGVTIEYWPEATISTNELGPTDVSVRVYGGNKDRVKLTLQENVETFPYGYRSTVAGPAEYVELECVMKGEDRLISVDRSNPASIKVYHNSVDGYLDGDLHIDVAYDYSGNGNYSKIGSMIRHIPKKKDYVKAIEIGQAAIEDAERYPEKYSLILGLNIAEWLKDIRIIEQYFKENYSYYNDSIDGSGLNARCTGGATLLRVWTAYRHHIYGYVGAAPGNISHVAFYPGIDAFNKGLIPQRDVNSLYFDAEGSEDPKRNDPLNLNVTRDGNVVHASWNKIDGAARYYINTGAVTETITNNFYDFDFADNNNANNYTVKVTAYDNESYIIGYEQVEFYKPVAITNVMTTLSEDKTTVNINWDAVKGADHYVIVALGREIIEENIKKNSYSFDYKIYQNTYFSDLQIYAEDSTGNVIASISTSFNFRQ